ncbi:MAG TPA: hypothetical protein VG940_06715 [Gemmatimonadales bacterium]|nr:hypothetical protein [Gemmatimonadales bacterium]
MSVFAPAVPCACSEVKVAWPFAPVTAVVAPASPPLPAVSVAVTVTPAMATGAPSASTTWMTG